MSRLSRLVLAGACVGAGLFAAPAQAEAPECVKQPCYVCVMYPCYPSDWPPFLIDRVSTTVCNVAGC